jgi:hypothetical protein
VKKYNILKKKKNKISWKRATFLHVFRGGFYVRIEGGRKTGK